LRHAGRAIDCRAAERLILAGAIGGALGAQDPELQRISARNSIAQQIDYNSPTSIMDGQRALARLGDTVGAMQLASIGRDLEYKQAQTSQSMAAAGASRAQTVKTQAEIDEIARQQKAYAALSGGTPVAAAAAPMAAPGASGMLEGGIEIAVDEYNTPYQVATPSAIAPPGAAAPPVATAAVQTRPALNEQIAALERRREQFLALNKIPDAKAKAEMLGDQIKDLRGQLKPTEITNLEREISQLRADNVPDTDPRIKVRQDKITKLSSVGADRFGTDRESISLEVYDKPFSQLTQEQRKVVNQTVEESKGRTAERGAAKFVMPGDKTLADIPAFRRSVQQTIAPQLSTITAAGQALQSINDSITTGNFVSFNAARTQLARSLGDSQLSRRDIEQAGGDPSILGGLIDLTSRAITSTPSLDTQRKIQATLQAIQTVARKQAQGEVDQQRRIALRSPGYNPEAVNEALMFPELRGGAAPAAVPVTKVSPSDQALLDKYAPRKP
jgi:hypothetical protein